MFTGVPFFVGQIIVGAVLWSSSLDFLGVKSAHDRNTYYLVEAPNEPIIKTKKVWSRLSVYLVRGSDKTLKRINAYQPHTCVYDTE